MFLLSRVRTEEEDIWHLQNARKPSRSRGGDRTPLGELTALPIPCSWWGGG